MDDPAAKTMKEALSRSESILILKAFTKVFGMAGVRLGYLLCSNKSLTDSIMKEGQPWSVSGLAQAAGIAALTEKSYVTGLSKLVKEERPFLMEELSKLGLEVIPGEANYLLFSGPEDIYERLMERGILIRDCSNYPGLGKGWFRTSVRTREDNMKLLEVLREEL